MTGREFEDQIIRLARVHGYLVHHQRPMQRADGQWRSGISGDKGFPDLVLCGRGRVMFRECKVGRAKTTPEQFQWLMGMSDAGLDAKVWRPEMMDEIQADLARRAERSA